MEARNADWWHHFPVPFSCPQKKCHLLGKKHAILFHSKMSINKKRILHPPAFFPSPPPKKKNNVSHLPNESWESKGATLPNATPSHKIRPYEQFINHYDSWCLNHPLDSHNLRRLHHTPKRPSRLLGPTDVSLPIHPQFRRKLSEITAFQQVPRRGCRCFIKALFVDLVQCMDWWWRRRPRRRLTSRRVSAMKREACSSAKACPCFTADLRENWNDPSGGYKNSHGVIVPVLEKYQVPLFMEVTLTLLRHYLV